MLKGVLVSLKLGVFTHSFPARFALSYILRDNEHCHTKSHLIKSHEKSRDSESSVCWRCVGELGIHQGLGRSPNKLWTRRRYGPSAASVRAEGRVLKLVHSKVKSYSTRFINQ